MTVRVRFAPSPTGYLHIGGARTALFNWMFARQNGGSFILRIEDTDQKRYVPGSVENLIESLRWLGLTWDEGPDIGGPYGPYVQSERLALYQEWAHWLVENGHAYHCFCTPEQLEAARADQIARKLPLGYSRACRDLPAAGVAARLAAGEPSVIRFRMPLEGSTTFPDLIRGDITFQNSQIDDRVLLKSDGFPTYHLANVVDDHFMAISHILRADEWISTAPLHVNLYRAFGWEMPAIAHLPVILSPSGRGKLSKRDQAFEEEGSLVLVRTLDYPENGFLPQAVGNWLANVGWSFGEDVEKFTLEDALPRFRLADVNPAPAKLPFSKLEWLNGQYIQELEPLELAQAVRPILHSAGIEISPEALIALMPAMRVRLKRLHDVLPFLQFLDDDGWQPDPARLAHKKLPAPAARAAFRAAQAALAEGAFTLEQISADLTAIGEQYSEGGKAGPFLGTLRYAVTGQTVSPPVFESILALGRNRAIGRLKRAETETETETETEKGA
jgi:glutamyl-tRNA synthetase